MEGLLDRQIYIETPLAFSKYLTDVISKSVYLKLENTQPSGSFKLRGISSNCKQKLKEGYKGFVGSSGGNAGIALAYTANQLQVPCHLFMPTNVQERMLTKIRSYGTEITVIGDDFKMANDQALKMAHENPEVGFIHPYDHPSVWDGNSTLVQEMKTQLNGLTPSCIVVSVGGGGLLLGILQGLKETGWDKVPVLAVETVGADCFNKSIAAGKIIETPITSIAKTLGARSVAPKLMEVYPNFNIISKVLTDKEAVSACRRFADQHQYLVEPACGVSLATVYENIIASSLRESGFDLEDGPVVVVVCGGSDCTPEGLIELTSQFNIL